MATKAELIEKLKAAGVELTGEESAADLKALAAEHLSEEKDEEADEEASATGKKGKFVVLDGNGKVFRTVASAEEAEKLAAHIEGRVQR